MPIDVIKPALPAQTHAPIAIHFAFGVSRTSFLDRLAHFARLALQNFSASAALSVVDCVIFLRRDYGLFELGLVLVRLDHDAGIIVGANHSIM